MFRSPLLISTAIALSCAACAVEAPAEVSTSEAALSSNLVSTTYYSCQTGEIVGEKTTGCVSGPGALTGSTSSCRSIESEPCDTVDYYNYIDFCVASACDRFPYPLDPGPYALWLFNR